MTDLPKTSEKKVMSVLGVLLWILIILAILIFSPKYSLCAWVLAIGLMLVLFVAIGKTCTEKWFGVLIDVRNKVSLARFQVTLWTILFLASIFTAALLNIFGGQANPLDIKIPDEFWALMGISVTSLAGSSLIKFSELKKDRLHVRKKDDENPSFKDMFMGDDVGNFEFIDLSKVQMFFFTIIVVLVYAVNLGGVFVEQYTHIKSFPTFHSGLLVLIGISHAGYLTYKAFPHPKVEANP